MIATKLSQLSDFDQKSPEVWVKNVNTDLNNIFLLDQGQVRFGNATANGSLSPCENISGQFYIYTTNAAPDTTDTIFHTLGATPQGYIVIRNNKSGVIYDAGTTWTPNQIYLKCSAASMLVTLFLIK